MSERSRRAIKLYKLDAEKPNPIGVLSALPSPVAGEGAKRAGER